MDIGKEVERGTRRINIPAIPQPERRREPERERELVPAERERRREPAPLKERGFYDDD